MYAEVAPLPPAIADHIFRYFVRTRKNVAEAESLFLAEVREKRRDTFDVFDPFVRTGALTRSIVLDKLAVYGHDVAQNTFTYWQQGGLVEMDRHGEINPLSAQSLLIAGMIDQRQRGFLPPSGVPAGETWHCYIQRSPGSEIETWPVGLLHKLPPATICWTPTASAYWIKNGWHLIGEGEGFLGCVRFAGIRMLRGHIWYNVSIDEICMWDADVAALYSRFPGDDSAQVQALCYPLFHRLGRARLKG